MRDIAHEQISASTAEELSRREYEIERQVRIWGGCLPSRMLSELQRIKSELYCRANGIASEPWVTHVAGVRARPPRRAD